MPRLLLCLFLAAIAVGLALAQDNPQPAKIKKIDADKGIVTLTVNGKDVEAAVTERTQFRGEGREIKEGLKSPLFKEGADVMFLARERDVKLVLVGMRL